jgi:hypothetical protein
MNYRTAVKSVPGDLIYIGYTWETLREHHFARLTNWQKASEIREIRKLYAARLQAEYSMTIDLEEGFS